MRTAAQVGGARGAERLCAAARAGRSGAQRRCRAVGEWGGDDAAGTPTDARFSSTATGTEFVVANFYAFCAVEDPGTEVETHRTVLNGMDVRGRIYICSYGINAQLSGPRLEAEAYCRWTAARIGFPFARCSFWPIVQNGKPEDLHQFPRLRVCERELVQLPGGAGVDDGMGDLLLQPDAQAGATALSPEDWKAAMAVIRKDPTKGGVVLDVRNDYEWDAGHFESAERPSCNIFRDTDDHVLGDALKDVDKDAPVYMYCTGGIRCDAYSRVLRREGFTNLNTLAGGVQRYLKHELNGNDEAGPNASATDAEHHHWTGSLYVFDGRGSIAGGADAKSEAEFQSSIVESNISGGGNDRCQRCVHCGGPTDTSPPLRNCANVDCNDQFLCCSACADRMKGCCSEECTKSARLRPVLAPGETYRRWGFYMQEEHKPPPGFGKNRRRRRQQRQRGGGQREQSESSEAISSAP